MNRDQIIGWLVTNCDCWKGKEKVLQNKEAFTDYDLKKLKVNADQSNQMQLVVNMVHEGFGMDKGVTLNAMPAHLKKLMEDPEDDDDDEDEDEEEEEEVTPKKKPTKNSLKDWMASAPLEVQSAVTNAMKIERGTKLAIVRKLVANVADEAARQSLGERLMKKDLDELQELSQLATPTQSAAVEPEQYDFTGAAGGPVGNRLAEAERSDILELPTINWAEQPNRNGQAVGAR